MKTIIKNKIKSILSRTCKHDYERFAFYRIANKEVLRCKKCDNRKIVQH